MKEYLIVVIVFIAVLGGVSYLFRQNQKLQAENERQSGNVSTLMGAVEKYEVRDSLNVASVSALNLTIAELKCYRADDVKLIKELGVKNKNLESIIKTGIHTSDTIRVIKWHPAPNNPNCLEYSDKWATITASFKDSTVLYSVREVWLWWYIGYQNGSFFGGRGGRKGIGWRWLTLIRGRRLSIVRLCGFRNK